MRLFGMLALGGTATVALVACKACRPRSPAAPAAPARAAAPALPASATPAPGYDLTPRPVDAIPPGTVVGDGPPDGWSHLIVKSRPRVRPAHRGEVNALTARMAGWMVTAFVADVRPGPDGRFALRAVALGLGTAVNGRDVVVTPDTAERLGADPGWIGSAILKKGYERQEADARVRVWGPTFAVLDTPVWVRADGKNRLVRFRYALLADAATGRLDAVCWAVDPDGRGGGPAGAVIVAANAMNDAELIPDKNEFTFGVPSEAGFGVDALPPGRPLPPFPPPLRAAADAGEFTPASAAALEAGLRNLLAAR